MARIKVRKLRPKPLTFRAYQADAFQWAKNKSKIALLMKMRLGKTLVTIRWGEYRTRRARKPKLVVSPVTVQGTWISSLWGEGKKCVRIPSPENERVGTATGSRWYVVSYGYILAHPEILREHDWGVVVLDESTHIRNPESQTAQLISNLCIGVPNKAILSGLINPESSLDVFMQYLFLMERFCGHTNYWKFRADLYEPAGRGGWDWRCTDSDRVRAQMHPRTFRLSYADAGVDIEPEIVQRRFQLPAKIRKVYEKAKKEFYFDGDETNDVIVIGGWLARITGGCVEGAMHKAKMSALMEELDENSDIQVAIACRYTAEIDAIMSALKKRGIEADRIWGKQPARRREAILSRFRAGRFRILVLQAKCAQFGIDCSNADLLIAYSRWWDAEVNQQLNMRTSHVDKLKGRVVDLVAEDTIDEDISDSQDDKRISSKVFLSRLHRELRHPLRKG